MHEDLIRRWIQALTDGNFDALVAADISAPIKARAAAVREKLGAFAVVADDIIVDGDRVAWRWTLTAAGIVMHGANFQRIADGKVVEHWTIAAPK